MKHFIIIALMLGMCVGAFAQSEPADPCCGIIAKDIKNNLLVARDNTTGRLYQFKADALDMKGIKKGDAVSINLASKKVMAISGALRNYPVIQPDNAEPLSILTALRIDNIQPVNDIVTSKINNTEPFYSIVNIQIDNAEPVSKPTIYNAEPVSKPKINTADPINVIVTAQEKSGKTFYFKVPDAIARTLKIGDPVYIQPVNGMQINYLDPVNSIHINTGTPINDFAIVHSSYGSSSGQMNSYGYSATSGDATTGNGNATDKWVITPVSNIKGVLGRLDISFPADVERNILIYRPADNKFITSVSWNDKIYSIAPGEYRFTLTSVPVDNVPIQKGHETRLKAGYLNIVSEGDWHLYDDAKKKAYTSGNKPQKIVLPVGSYQIKLGTEIYPVLIKDKETVEY